MTNLRRYGNLTGSGMRKLARMRSVTALVCIVCACRTAVVASFVVGRGSRVGGKDILSRHSPRSVFSSAPPSFVQLHQSSDNNAGGDVDAAASEAVQSLANFHVGSWRGTAQSFGVSADVAAGILVRRKSPSYTAHMTLTSSNTWEEKIEWMLKDDSDTIPEPSVRSINFAASNMDVDAVDASYSLDVTLPDLSSTLVGSDQLQQFLVEHCIAVSDNHRSRLLALYSATDQSLLRVVVCEETRMVPMNTDSDTDHNKDTMSDSDKSLTMAELVEMQGDVDRLVDKIAGQVKQQSPETSNAPSSTASASESTTADLIASLSSKASGSSSSASQQQQQGMQPYSNNDENANGLSPHTISLLELSSGLWLGDTVVRDMSSSYSSASARSGKGFGSGGSSSSTPQQGGDSKPSAAAFGSWSMGVQKVAWRWMWNFGEEIRQIVDAGKAMGTAMVVHAPSSSGSVCVNESLSRRMQKDDRMVYVDWNGDNVGFMVGAVSIQLPRYLIFDRTRQIRPFYTEFCVFQSTKTKGENALSSAGGSGTLNNDEEMPALPELLCSKISRLYSADGRLQQGCTSFFTLQRFGATDTEETE